MAGNRYMKVTATLRRNGANVGPIDVSRLSGLSIKDAILRSLAVEVDAMFQVYLAHMSSSLRARKRALVGDYVREKQLFQAYEMAVAGSSLKKTDTGVSMSLFKSSEIDRVMQEGRSDKHALWWRAHEYGNPSGRVLGSSEYRFVKKSGFGRHGEGFMVPRRTKDGTMAGKPHPGSKPFRMIPTMKMMIADELRNSGFRDRVMRRAVSILRSA